MEFMKFAIEEAKKAVGDIPVGAVIVKDGEVIASAFNTKEKDNDVTSHAEILAIRKAEQVLGNWRLDNCDMYVTLEPCAMCAGAILNSRIKCVHIACLDTNHGAVVSKYNLLTDGTLNHKAEIIVGERENEAKHLIQTFFKNLRKIIK